MKNRTISSPARHALRVAGVWLVGLLVTLALAGREVNREQRLQAIRGDIQRLQEEVRGLGHRAQGLLGDLDRLGAELNLRRAERQAAELLLESLAADIGERRERLSELAEAQQVRAGYLAFRLREMYKGGPAHRLHRLLGGADLEQYGRGVGYAAYLSQRDGRVLADYRRTGQRLEGERQALEERRAQISTARAEAARVAKALMRARSDRARLLKGIQEDRARRREALSELEEASRQLTRLVESLDFESAGPTLSVEKFRGLLDWPVAGRISAGFGQVTHPRFKTVVPHPGWDLDAAEGTSFVSVFEGTVVYAAWLHGYGLTAIVDHGQGLVSIYAHAAVLIVSESDVVYRGQPLGKVGDTGSLRGAYLYFELREDGRPVDPHSWLRARVD